MAWVTGRSGFKKMEGRVKQNFAGTAVTRQVAVGAANLSVVDMRWASE